jgi:hypothetical protein
MKLIDSIFRLSLSVRGFVLPIMVCDHNGPLPLYVSAGGDASDLNQ